MTHKTIKWGIDDDPGVNQVRSDAHIEFLISEHNKNKPESEHVHTMSGLIRALKQEIEELKEKETK